MSEAGPEGMRYRINELIEETKELRTKLDRANKWKDRASITAFVLGCITLVLLSALIRTYARYWCACP